MIINWQACHLFLLVTSHVCFPSMCVLCADECIRGTYVLLCRCINWRSVMWQALCCLWSIGLLYDSRGRRRGLLVFSVALKSLFKCLCLASCYCLLSLLGKSHSEKALHISISRPPFIVFKYFYFFFSFSKESFPNLEMKIMQGEGKKWFRNYP